MGVAGYPTTTAAIPLFNNSLENAGILAGLYNNNGKIGESLSPYKINPSLFKFVPRYLALKASLSSHSRPFIVPSSPIIMVIEVYICWRTIGEIDSAYIDE